MTGLQRRRRNLLVPSGGGIVNYTMLYDMGNECTDVTGGWVAGIQNGGYVEKQAARIHVGNTSASSSYSGVHTANMLNLADYEFVYFVAQGVAGYYHAYPTLGFANKILGLSDFVDNYSTPTSHSATLANGVLAKQVLCAVPYSGNYYVYEHLRTYHTGYEMYLYAIMAVKADAWQQIATLAGITASTISAIVTSATNCAAVLSNSAAVNYMLENCTGDFMAAAIASSTFTTALNSSTYKNQIYANEHWGKFLSFLE